MPAGQPDIAGIADGVRHVDVAACEWIPAIAPVVRARHAVGHLGMERTGDPQIDPRTDTMFDPHSRAIAVAPQRRQGRENATDMITWCRVAGDPKMEADDRSLSRRQADPILLYLRPSAHVARFGTGGEHVEAAVRGVEGIGRVHAQGRWFR